MNNAERIEAVMMPKHYAPIIWTLDHTGEVQVVYLTKKSAPCGVVLDFNLPKLTPKDKRVYFWRTIKGARYHISRAQQSAFRARGRGLTPFYVSVCEVSEESPEPPREALLEAKIAWLQQQVLDLRIQLSELDERVPL